MIAQFLSAVTLNKFLAQWVEVTLERWGDDPVDLLVHFIKSDPEPDVGSFGEVDVMSVRCCQLCSGLSITSEEEDIISEAVWQAIS